MRVRSIDHVSINVKDFDASVAFYGGVLGFRRLQTVPMAGFSITYFEIPGGGRMELFDYKGGSTTARREESEVGLRHLAFTVEDVEAAEKALREKGVTIVLPTTDLPSLGAKVMLFLDPNGVTLEVCQKL
ncbi:MAG TPA: VOC family protein [Spirochaetia bacterium]|nr:VOC family protein [Spirochaetia bacterium]